MLHLIWYIFVGFLVGCVAKALMHTHLSITWTIVLGIIGSIIGGAVTHLFYPPGAGGKFHLGGLIVSIIGAILVLYIWHKFRLQLLADKRCKSTEESINAIRVLADGNGDRLLRPWARLRERIEVRGQAIRFSQTAPVVKATLQVN